jgi:hypothetical protein
MKKATIIITIAMAMLMAGCKSNKFAVVSDNERSEISWNAFCDANGYDRNNNSTVDEYLDAWCGSVAEEEALIKAGVEPF